MLSSLRRVSGPSAEVLDLSTVVDHCRLDSDADNTLLEGYIAAAREWAEGWLGRALAPQRLAWTVADVAAASAPTLRFAPSPASDTLLVPSMTAPWPPRRPLELPRAPVSAVVSIVAGGLAAEDRTLTAGDYELDLTTDPARLLLRPSAALARAERMTVTFDAGYPDADAVPRTIRQALLLLVAHFHEHRGDAGGEIPPVVRLLLRPHRLTGFA